MEECITLERAVTLIRRSVSPVDTERIPVTRAHGRILAEPVFAPMDQPPFPRSPLDGYAFHAADSGGATKAHPIHLKVVETIYAGDWTERVVQRGEAVRLMTGAPVPAGCDCVIRHENTDNGRERVRVFSELNPWDNYCERGEDFRLGAELLPAGSPLSAVAYGILAAAGLDRADSIVTVYRRPCCALFCTGDELVSGSVRPLPPGKIYSSNEACLRTRLMELGVELINTETTSCADDADQLVALLQSAAEQADMILTTGGVSAGDRDILHQTLPALNADRIFKRVRMKPGAPMMFSLCQGIPVLSLSGNPFAAFATFELVGRQLLAVLSGTDTLLPQVFPARLETPFPKTSTVRRFVRGLFRNGSVCLPDGHSSGQLASAAQANCLVDIPAGSGKAAPGETFMVHLL